MQQNYSQTKSVIVFLFIFYFLLHIATKIHYQTELNMMIPKHENFQKKTCLPNNWLQIYSAISG